VTTFFPNDHLYQRRKGVIHESLIIVVGLVLFTALAVNPIQVSQ
jgi:hypothetical protein